MSKSGINLKQKIISKAAEFMVGNIGSPPPSAKVKKPLSESKVAFITTSGVHLKRDNPFDTKGDYTFRLIPEDTDFKDLTITHDHYDKSEALKDINCVFPLERLRSLKDKGFIKEVAPRNFGLMGYIPQTDHLINISSPLIADALEEDEVDIALFSPG